MRIENHPFLRTLWQRMVLALLLAICCGAATAGVLRVSIDTSGFGVAEGYLDMQFGGNAGAPLATAVASNFAGFGGTPDIQWDVDAVAGGYAFRNDTANLLSHAVSFGGVLSFDLAISGAHDPSSAYISDFTVAAFDGVNYLGAAHPLTGALATFSWIPSTVAGGGGNVLVAVNDPSVHVVPEPGTLPLALAGLLLMGIGRRVRVGIYK